METVRDIALKFGVLGDVDHFEICGMGHINNTYLVTTKHEFGIFKYIVQKINTHVFKDPAALMDNIVAVTDFIRGKIKARGEDCGRATLRFLKTDEGKYFYTTESGDVYRCYLYVGNVASIQIANDPHYLYLAGVGFGRFQKNLDGFNASILSEAIPNFHHTVKRLEAFKEAVSNDIKGRKKDVEKEIEFFLSRADYASRVLDLIASGKMPLRVTHNDTKLNNVLLDIYGDNPVAVIDLDTIMPGSILYDFGDCIRSGANTGAEDEKDLTKVQFSMEMFDAFSRGFVSEVATKLTECEIENMAFGAILMTYECGLRFLTDHLNGDVYFKIHREEHNLDRTRTQIKMIEEMESLLPEMDAVIRKYAN